MLSLKDPAHAQGPGGGSIADLLSITDPKGGDGVPAEAWAIIDYLLLTQTPVAGLTGQPTPPKTGVPQRLPNAFYERLAVGLMCKTVSTIGSRNLSRMVDGNKAAKFVSDHIRSPEVKGHSAFIYTYLLESRVSADGSTLSDYTRVKGHWGPELAQQLTSQNFMTAAKLKAVGNPAKARYDLKVTLWILSLLSDDNQERWRKVLGAWQQESGSVFALAANDEWPPPNLFVPNYDRANPLDPHIRDAARRTRESQGDSWGCAISETFFAEELADAVRRHAGPLGLHTGATHDVSDSQTYCSPFMGGKL
jgi:hypothetical protein